MTAVTPLLPRSCSIYIGGLMYKYTHSDTDPFKGKFYYLRITVVLFYKIKIETPYFTIYGGN